MEYYTIKSHPDYEITKCGIVRKKSTKAIKSQYVNEKGYYLVSFRYGSKTMPQRVHRLVAETFLQNVYNKTEINHKDGDKKNNSVENLEWCTHSENIKHACDTGLTNNVGSNNGMSKLKESDIPQIRQLLRDGLTQDKIANMFNVSRSAILLIKLNKRWMHIK